MRRWLSHNPRTAGARCARAGGRRQQLLLRAAFDEKCAQSDRGMKRLRWKSLTRHTGNGFDSAGQLFWNMNTSRTMNRVADTGERDKRERKGLHEQRGIGQRKIRQFILEFPPGRKLSKAFDDRPVLNQVSFG